MFRSLIFRPALFGNMATSATGPLVYDTFTGPNGTLLTAHAPDIDTVGGGWLTGTSSAAITSNEARSSAATNIIDCALSDVVISTVVRVISSGAAPGVIARYTDATNYWRIIIGPTNLFRMQQVTGGVATTRATSSPTITVGQNYQIVVTLSGTTISATLDGGNDVSYGSAAQGQASTLHGLIFLLTTCAADDFTITT